MMKRTATPLLVMILLMSLLSLQACSREEAKPLSKEAVSFRFGVLPVIQALPVFVAAEKEYFTQAGIDVELVTFDSAMEKDIALSSGEIAGYFGDMMTPMVLIANGVPVKIIATNFRTTKPHHMFALMAAPDKTADSLKILVREGVAVSSDTFLEYITTKMLIAQGVSPSSAKKIEAQDVPLRLQMLLTGQVPSAVLPEPLVTLAETRGARVIADDVNLGVSSTILAFSESFLTEYSDAVKTFCSALNRASAYINANHESVRTIMNDYCQIPDALKENYTIPPFCKLTRPREELVMDIQKWLKEKGIITQNLTYDGIVSNGAYY